ncbi:cytochrome p450 [Fusarium heterosporum]|uniref:Cytochrome p450 n=1 Tax=Fusarium heterosporum TaxID=42747 RepID=A0A8H5TCR7_FUSHE|nr:cytochrome p450 [Fusarium heterosporum]
MGWGKTVTFLPFGNRWQMHRKRLQTSFSNTNVRQWHSLQTIEARRTVRNLIKNPKSWETSLRRFAVAVILQVSYGTEVLEDDDPYIQLVNDAMYATGNGGVPANSLVDLVPSARYLPDWIVRDWSLQFARKWRWAIQKLHDVPFAAAQSEYQDWSLEDIKGAAGAVLIAGADTTWATCTIFILNMVLYPMIQMKAQKELDAVIGTDRLPQLSDRPSLPYIEHIVQEIYRVRLPSSRGVNTTIRWCGDCLISVRTVVYANARAIAHDERVYKDPHDFNPDRYQAGEPFPIGNFGFGRRICVGRYLADNSVWIMVATMLSTLQFCKKVDSDGTPIEPRVQFTNGGTWSVELSSSPHTQTLG